MNNRYHIMVAENGEVGWEKALAFPPDLIISDVMMPKMDGLQFCEKVKSDMRTSHIPVILLTAKVDQEARVSGLEHGADAYLAKPFDKRELFARMDQLLALRRDLQVRYGQPDQLPNPLPKLAREDKFIQQVRIIMEENLHEEAFLLETIWETLGMSRPQFYRKFKAVTDMTPAEYLLALRLHKGYELLMHGKLRVAEVAFQVGFRNAGHFSKKFTQHYGRTPSTIRKDNG